MPVIVWLYCWRADYPLAAWTLALSPRPPDHQKAHEGHERLLGYQHPQQPPHGVKPGQQAPQGRRLGQLVRDGVQRLAQIADVFTIFLEFH